MPLGSYRGLLAMFQDDTLYKLMYLITYLQC